VARVGLPDKDISKDLKEVTVVTQHPTFGKRVEDKQGEEDPSQQRCKLRQWH
jgi:hypothetical protein